MKKMMFWVLVMAAVAFSAVVSPSQSTLAILLDASGLCNDSSVNSWKKMGVDDFLKAHAFYGNVHSIYCHSYDDSKSPAEVADSLFKGKTSVFNKALSE
ncbi:hypothetical protein B7988_13500 [Fibrobacter sp. UWB1]|uniref:hypothetical protein n=1 Tax=Fibrobacter sp. UWB1 TaxID=1964355 RepID=UPI000B51ED7D|nr:hypothetical protein [Fibrobacter sp. UWB1]OWV24883.1 hypothetical protein B7988_13500 [Fibrobacter sp. UWB1]